MTLLSGQPKLTCKEVTSSIRKTTLASKRKARLHCVLGLGTPGPVISKYRKEVREITGGKRRPRNGCERAIRGVESVCRDARGTLIGYVEKLIRSIDRHRVGVGS